VVLSGKLWTKSGRWKRGGNTARLTFVNLDRQTRQRFTVCQLIIMEILIAVLHGDTVTQMFLGRHRHRCHSNRLLVQSSAIVGRVCRHIVAVMMIMMFVGRHQHRRRGNRLLVQSRAIVGRVCRHIVAVMMMMVVVALRSRQHPQLTSTAGTMALVLLATGLCLYLPLSVFNSLCVCPLVIISCNVGSTHLVPASCANRMGTRRRDHHSSSEGPPLTAGSASCRLS